MAHDALSALLELVGARSSISGGFVAGGAWAIRFPPPKQLKFFVAARGECWLRVDGEGPPLRIREGDVFLRASAGSFELLSDFEVPPLDATAVYANGSRALRHLGEGEEFLFFSGHVLFEPTHARLLVESLPTLPHLPAGSSEAGSLKWLIQQEERVDDAPKAPRPPSRLDGGRGCGRGLAPQNKDTLICF